MFTNLFQQAMTHAYPYTSIHSHANPTDMCQPSTSYNFISICWKSAAFALRTRPSMCGKWATAKPRLGTLKRRRGVFVHRMDVKQTQIVMNIYIYIIYNYILYMYINYIYICVCVCIPLNSGVYCFFAAFGCRHIKVTFDKKPFGILRYQPGKAWTQRIQRSVGYLGKGWLQLQAFTSFKH